MEIIVILLALTILCLAIGLSGIKQDGLRPDRPIRTGSVNGEYVFLSHLLDSRGAHVQALRRGVLAVPGFREPVDWWVVRKTNGKCTNLYLYGYGDGYGEAPAPRAPSGFRLDAEQMPEGFVQMERPKPGFSGKEPVEFHLGPWNARPNLPEDDQAMTVKIGNAVVPPPDGFIPLAACDEKVREEGERRWREWLDEGFQTSDIPCYIGLEGDNLHAGIQYVVLDRNGDILAIANAYRAFNPDAFDQRVIQELAKPSLFARGAPQDMTFEKSLENVDLARGNQKNTFAPFRDSDIELQWHARRWMGPYARGLLRVGGETLGLAMVILFPAHVNVKGCPFWVTRDGMSAWSDKIRKANGLPAFDEGEKSIRLATKEEEAEFREIQPAPGPVVSPDNPLLVHPEDHTVAFSGFALKVLCGGRQSGHVWQLPQEPTILGRGNEKSLYEGEHCLLHLDMDDRPELAKHCCRRYAKISVEGDCLFVEVLNTSCNKVVVDGQVLLNKGDVAQAKVGSHIMLNPDWEFEVVRIEDGETDPDGGAEAPDGNQERKEDR